ncbi:MAG: DUF4091 domain-containing protein [Muribaculaceae bacterium]|nr:DUF4091 domain-containing protein [Muribaculaceae bacterium]
MGIKSQVLAISTLAVTMLAGCQKSYTPVDTFKEADDPLALTAEESAQWDAVESGLHGAWGDADLHYSRSTVPQGLSTEACELVAWKGEKESAQLVLWSTDSVDGITCEIGDFKSDAATLPGSIADARFVRYTIADSLFSVGKATRLMPDMLDSLKTFDMEAKTVRPMWITISVPENATAGLYNADVTVKGVNGEKVVLPMTLEVQDHTLASPDKWNYHLDLWQHPTAVARAQGLELWSDEHFAAMVPLMERLAAAGQKVVTANLNKDPWNHQCYDGYENMINWTLKKDGTWEYDYAVFDRWVEMMMGLGINEMINCYSMVPWNCELEYFDEAKGEKVTVVAEPGTEIFGEIWEPFLLDFKKHLGEKGWLEITNIAMDERSPEAMDAAVKVLEKCAPEMGFALADNHKSYKKYTMMRDVCVAQRQPAEHSDIESRRDQGYKTTFYVCCGPLYPNTFTYSEPFEAELLGWYGLAWDYDGMLRWAYNSWPADPQSDSRYGNWSSGDTYLVYPYNRSSMRFERLIDGIETAEKVRALRAAGVDVSGVDAVLEEIRNSDVNDPQQPWQAITKKARKALDEASRK